MDQNKMLTIVVLVVVIFGVFLTIKLLPNHEKDTSIKINEKTGLCPVIQGCTLIPIRDTGYCYFKEDC